MQLLLYNLNSIDNSPGRATSQDTKQLSYYMLTLFISGILIQLDETNMMTCSCFEE